MRAILYLMTFLLTHHAASIIQLSLHRVLGHRKKCGYISRIHADEHHGIYSRNLLVSESYLDEAKSVDYFYAIPILLLAACVFLLVPLDIFLVHIATLSLSTFAHFYLHVQYHLRNTWLKRYQWFKRKQRLHLLHHRDMTRNYAVIEFFWDRVLGTFEDAPATR